MTKLFFWCLCTFFLSSCAHRSSTATAPLAMGPEKPTWWQKAVIYQIYPRSFQDSNGDGVGDLAGITKRLDHVKALGADAIWLSPIFPSPMRDAGYDISNYEGIEPLFGTLEDFDQLLAAAHDKGLKVLLDFVPNHTSDEHPWFKASRSSRKDPKRDWYLWKDPLAKDTPPNNWRSVFGGSAWQFDAAAGQSYYHAFLREQPDLNWRNPEVQKAMFAAMRFWLDRGVDGFRLDAPLMILEDASFRDNPVNKEYRAAMPDYQKVTPIYTRDLDELHPLIAQMRKVFDAYQDKLFILETNLDTPRLVTYYGKEAPEAQLPFNFQLIFVAWKAAAVENLIKTYTKALPAGAWPNWVLGNHDQPRFATRVGAAQARVAAMLLLTLRGTPTIYYGEELGLRDVPIPADRVQDNFEKNDPGKGNGRDPERTPMPWDASRNAAFTSGKPWLPLNGDFKKVNVAQENKDRSSMLKLYEDLLRLRRGETALSLGEQSNVETQGDVLLFSREAGGARFHVLLNFSNNKREIKKAGLKGTIVLSTQGDRGQETIDTKVVLKANEGVVLRAVP